MIISTKIISVKIFCSVFNKNVVVPFEDMDWQSGENDGGYFGGDYDGTVLGYFKCNCGELHEIKIG